MMRTATLGNTHQQILGVLSRLDKRETEWAIQFLTQRLAMAFPIRENNKNRLEQELHDIMADESLKASGMEEISTDTLDSARTFVGKCPSDELMDAATFSPRQNGTFLLCWNVANFMASVNIGDGTFSYAIFSPAINYEDCGEGNVSDADDIISFYKKLKDANERLQAVC